MSSTYIQARREWLLASQNRDGGWGYFPDAQSWLEPTIYAMLALHGREEAKAALERGWRLVRGWQMPDGAWRPAAGIDQPCWATALAVTLHCVRGAHDEPFRRGVRWLVGTKGAEGTLVNRMLHWLRPTLIGHDSTLLGWPWVPETTSWVEPTAHALVALKKARAALGVGGLPEPAALGERVRTAERMLLNRRCRDGGWNYGNRQVLGEWVASYPETTAVALLGLHGNGNFDRDRALDGVVRLHGQTRSRLARAWLALCLRTYGRTPGPVEVDTHPPRDLMLAALETLACAEGNHALLGVEGRA